MYNLHIIMFHKTGQIQDVGKKERKSTSRKCAVRKGDMKGDRYFSSDHCGTSGFAGVNKTWSDGLCRVDGRKPFQAAI